MTVIEPEAAPLPAPGQGTAPGLGRLVGQRVLVLGAGSASHGLADAPVGVGRAIAEVLGREGAVVGCADRDAAAAEATAAAIVGAGGRAVTLVADVAAPDGCTALIDDAVEAMGGLTSLVCNVANPGVRSIAATTPDDWDRVYDVNVRSFFLTTRASVGHLGPGSSVVYIGSTAGARGGSGSPAYDSSKAAVVGLMRAAAVELGPRAIRVNAVNPGPIDSAMSRSLRGNVPRSPDALRGIPLQRTGTAWEVAYAVLFMVGDEASYVTGQVLDVDGGAFFRPDYPRT